MPFLNRYKNLVFLLFLVLVSFPSILSLFKPGFFQSDDGEWMIIRFSAFHQALRDGEFPVRWLGRLNHEYGYPVANFLYPGFMYLGEPIHVAGFGFVDTVKILFGVSMVASAVFTYLWLAKLFDRLPSFAGALFYLYTPYHLFDLYKRGSLGEILSLAVIPFILWQIERESFVWPTIGIAFLILSHNTLALLFVPVVVFYMMLNLYISKKKKALLVVYTSMLSLGLGLPSFFWIPAIFDLQYTIFHQVTVSEWHNYFASYDLIGFSTISIFFFVFILFATGKASLVAHKLTVFLFFVGITSLLLSVSISAPLWKILPVLFIQFPFRFLSLTILSVSFLSAFFINQLRGERTLITLVLLLLLIVSALPYSQPKIFFDKGDSYYTTNEASTTVRNEYMPKWVKIVPVQRPNNKVEMVGFEEGKVSNLFSNSRKISFTTNFQRDGIISLNTMYFPGWRIYVDGKEKAIDYSNTKGVMQLTVPAGSHIVEGQFTETRLRLFSDSVSVISVIILVLVAARLRVSNA